MQPIPSDGAPDSTLALLREGYRFVSRRCERLGTDAFETRLLLRRAGCGRGEAVARMFYAPDRFTRRGAMPPQVLRLLQDKGSVATLDGAAHRHRKAMFIELAGPGTLGGLCAAASEAMRLSVETWTGRDRVVLHDALCEILCRAACAWAGVPVTEAEVHRRTRELAAMIAGTGTVGPRSWHALALRARTERWARGIIRRVRAGSLECPGESPLSILAQHRDADGRELPVEVAAVELINLLRPTVAVARYATFAALALHRHPECRERVAADPAYRWLFVQEVRRFYPFFPLVAGKAREAFEWRGRRFEAGAWVILDLYGTGHDPVLWDRPEEFRPERFETWRENAFAFIPQGGGDQLNGHRCPGEWATIALLETLSGLLAATHYRVPPQDLSVDLSRIPALPASGFVIADVRAPG